MVRCTVTQPVPLGTQLWPKRTVTDGSLLWVVSNSVPDVMRSFDEVRGVLVLQRYWLVAPKLAVLLFTVANPLTSVAKRLSL